MRVLAVLIFTCLLFQTATLERKPGTDGTQQRNPSTKPKQNPSEDLVQTRFGTDSNKPTPYSEIDTNSGSDLKDKSTPKLEIDTNSESDLKDKSTPKLETDTNSESDLKDKSTPKLEIDTNSESDLKDKSTPKLEIDTNSESDLDKSTPKLEIDTNSESDLKDKSTPKLEIDTNSESDLKDKSTPKLEIDTNSESDLKDKSTPKLETDTNSESDLKDKSTPKLEIDTNSESDLKDKSTPKLEIDTNSESDLKDKSTPKKEKDEHSAPVERESFSGPAQCLDQKYTRLSCSKVFCPPWRRCIAGQCVCKMPYKCPRQDYRACTLDGSEYYSMCQAKAISCRSKMPIFSHTNTICKAEDKVEVSLLDSGSDKVVVIKTTKGKMLVCGKDWNMAAANVVCRNPLNVAKGAERASKIRYKPQPDWPTECMKIRCMGSELSLAECTIYNPQKLEVGDDVVVTKCYTEPKDKCKFACANGKCLIQGKPCNGVDDCGDNSDEMCCQKCEAKAFHCKSGVCIPRHAVQDGIRDCLGGEDEEYENGELVQKNKTEDLFSDPMSEIRRIRSSTESQLQCGIPNLEYVYKQEDDATSHPRRKRLVGGEEALPTQIQWQVAIQDEGSIHCGGAYLGGCWVLTAAHCVRPKPKSYRIKFSLWKKHRKQTTTDSIPVKNIIIHHEYDPQTYANDIALVQLEELNLLDKCMEENPAVRAVCVPWSTQQFQPNDICTISGWGRDRAGKSAATLKWANVTIISDCKNYYKDRFLPGMECAGDLEGKVDSCQGDSGGPLVCKDASGLSYVWGIVSWGDKCGEPNYPGVYTKVAHYFDWIRFHTGWPAVTKFNQ